MAEDLSPAAKRTSLRALLGAAGALVALTFRAAPGRAAVAFALEPLAAILAVLTGLWLKLLVDAAAGRDVQRVLAVAAVIVASFALGRAASATGIRLRMGLQERVAFALEERLARLVAAVPGLEPFERPELLDQLDLLRRQRDYYWYSLNAVIQGLREVARLAGTVVLLTSVSPLLLPLPVLGLPTLFANIAARQRGERAAERTAEEERLAGHLLQSATSVEGGRELRIFGLTSAVERRWAAAAARADAVVAGVGRRSALEQGAAWLCFALGYAGAITLATFQAVDGRATAGDVLLVVTLAGGIAGNVRSVATWTGEVVEILHFLIRYVAVTRYAGGMARPDRATASAPARLERGIVLDGVSFRYPGSAQWALRDVSLRLPAGATVALVGDNGAGKTSLVKLLCRFYEPDQGRVLVDGGDLARLDPAAWRLRLAAGFQDFARLELLAREAVGVGDLARLEDGAAIQAALERAGAADLAMQMPNGLETLLGTTWGGMDLSGGQWQKLALGRAMLRAAPLLLILDEPTASLDAQTEHALFKRYAAATRRTRQNGGVTLLVSHRFSTVRMADLIVVLDGGRVVEQGSHEALLQRQGLYAELYALQARDYQ